MSVTATKRPSGIYWGEMAEMLRDEGFDNVCYERIKHALKVGHIDKPATDYCGRHVWTRRDIDNVRRYLANVPPVGRPKKQED